MCPSTVYKQHLNLEEAISNIQLVIFDFDGVFTNNTVSISEDGTESVQCWRSDGLGLSRLSEKNVKAVIVSTEKNPVVSVRSKKLNIKCFQGINDKKKAVLEICKDYGIDLKYVAFVGNDINDIAALKQVEIPIAVADAYPEILPFVVLKTSKTGGYGAVREVCDLIYIAKIKKEQIPREK